MNETKLFYYTIICDKKLKKKFIGLLSENGAAVISTTYGRGSARSGLIAKVFGFETEEHKAVISCLIPEEAARKTTDALVKDHNFTKANTGVAFAVPVTGIGF